MQRICWSVVALISIVSQAEAGFIVAPVGVTALTMGTASGNIFNTINQFGLSSGYTSGSTDFDTYVASNPTHATPNSSNAWAGLPGPVLGYIDYDLGASMMLESFALWNQHNTNSITSLTIFVSSNIGFVGATNVGTFNPLNPNPITVQTFATPAVGQYVRLQVNAINGGTNVNLAEIAFEQGSMTGSLVPEPTSLAIFGVGAGILGLCGVRRRKQLPASVA